MNDLISLDRIAETLGMRREFVRDRLVKRPDFPRPALVVSQKNRRWSLADVQAWLRSQAEAQAR